jgi:hypothetical protein
VPREFAPLGGAKEEAKEGGTDREEQNYQRRGTLRGIKSKFPPFLYPPRKVEPKKRPKREELDRKSRTIKGEEHCVVLKASFHLSCIPQETQRNSTFSCAQGVCSLGGGAKEEAKEEVHKLFIALLIFPDQNSEVLEW